MARGSTSRDDARARLGAYLRLLRERRGISQKDAAEIIFTKINESSSAANNQSTLARIEAGTISLKPDHLPFISIAYKEPLDRLLSAYTATVLLSGDIPRFLLQVSRRPYCPPGPGSHFFSSNVVEAWSLADIVAWERSLGEIPDPRRNLSLWIISPSFIDVENEEFLKTVVDYLLLRGANLTYFVAERDLLPRGKFHAFLDRVTWRLRYLCDGIIPAPIPDCSDPRRWGKISAFGLTEPDLVWFTSSLVIANPEDIQAGASRPEGFTILADEEGQHRFGIPISERDLHSVVNRIRFEIQTRCDSAYEGTGSWRPDALSSHPSFTREFASSC